MVEKRYPFQGLNGFSLSKKEDRQYDTEHGTKLVNEWARPGQRVLVFENADGKREHCVLPVERPGNAVNAIVSMIDVAMHAWTVEAELKAVELLRTLIKPHLFDAYVLTGAFIESSKRSGIMYVFRKLRPTLALAASARGDDMRVLCGLCLHPLGYYGGTYAGCLVPTDDVIAHLLMMRGDEHKFWAMANQFDPKTHGMGGFD